MNSERSWMYLRLKDGLLNPVFLQGIDEFIEFAKRHPECMDGIKIKCPCKHRKCQNRAFHDENTIRYHLMKYEFVQYYYQWIHHGDRYLQFEDQASQTQAGGGESPILDKVALFYEAVGGEKKNRVYGTGSQKSIFYPQSSCSSSKGASSMELQSRIIQLENKNKELQESLQAIREDRDDYREQVMRQMENMMKDFEARMRSQFTHQAS